MLSVSGFDPLGRAGLLADGWAIRSCGGELRGVVTAVTAQGDKFSSAAVAPGQIRAQMRVALEDRRVGAVKLGMVPNRGALEAIFASLGTGTQPIVIDPVVRTSRGDRLSTLVPSDFLRLGKKFGERRRLLLTPNRDELAWLGPSAARLVELGFWAVVVKGSQSAIDEIFSRRGEHTLRGSSLPRSTSHHRGTGCRFASGLAVHLAQGDDLLTAVRGAKRLVRRFLRTL